MCVWEKLILEAHFILFFYFERENVRVGGEGEENEREGERDESLEQAPPSVWSPSQARFHDPDHDLS